MRGKTPWAVRPTQKRKSEDGPRGDLDWESLLHPANAYSHPSDVVRDDDLTVSEKRAILASWASDASAVVSNPALRRAPSMNRHVAFDEIMEALRSLDTVIGPDEGTSKDNAPWRWPRDADDGQSLGRGDLR